MTKDKSEGFFPVTSICKDDIRDILARKGEVEDAFYEKAISELDEYDMRYIAKKVAEHFLNCCYWGALEDAAEYVLRANDETKRTDSDRQ